MEFLMFMLGLLSGILGTFLWAVFRVSGQESHREEKELHRKE
jgi:hypothetical protein